ncbi:MAG: hypothetical protein NT144_12615 [Bacteroidia bacterium]|nr:hypothetical protein [Bacteroidia bacterium]
MAENHFNALTLWNLHPFSYMLRTKNFPDACPYSDTELKVWQDWIVNTCFDEINNAGRKVEFIIRAHSHSAPGLTRMAVEENANRLGTVYMDVKFNWSHGHATPDLMYIHGGSRSKSLWKPAPKNYKMIFTIVSCREFINYVL